MSGSNATDTSSQTRAAGAVASKQPRHSQNFKYWYRDGKASGSSLEMG